MQEDVGNGFGKKQEFFDVMTAETRQTVLWRNTTGNLSFCLNDYETASVINWAKPCSVSA